LALLSLFVVIAATLGVPLMGQAAPLRLTLREAIEKGLQANLSVLVAGTRVQESEGTLVRRQSQLLPRVNAQNFANYQNRNLRAFGFSFPGIPEVIGPFSNYDFQFSAEQKIFDLQTYRVWKAAQEGVQSGKLDYQDARDLIVRAIAGLYLSGQTAQARIDAAQARVTASAALDQLARAKHDAGTATGVDVLRAQVQLANDRQALLVARNQYRLAQIALARNLGMDPGTPLELAEPLQFQPMAAASAESLVPAALRARSDYLSLASQRRGLVEQQLANRARNYPTATVSGAYGGLGRSIGGVRGIGIIQGELDFTIFDRDRQGEAQELASRVQRVDEQIADLRRGIEEDIREALLNLESAADQAGVAKDGRDLAQRELDLAQDRFQSGVTNNVEVVTAQDELARAQENYIEAMADYADAKFALARAAGGAEKNLGQYLGTQ
jgi:outer membrane protein TolC